MLAVILQFSMVEDELRILTPYSFALKTQLATVVTAEVSALKPWPKLSIISQPVTVSDELVSARNASFLF